MRELYAFDLQQAERTNPQFLCYAEKNASRSNETVTYGQLWWFSFDIEERLVSIGGIFASRWISLLVPSSSEAARWSTPSQSQRKNSFPLRHFNRCPHFYWVERRGWTVWLERTQTKLYEVFYSSVEQFQSQLYFIYQLGSTLTFSNVFSSFVVFERQRRIEFDSCRIFFPSKHLCFVILLNTAVWWQRSYW